MEFVDSAKATVGNRLGSNRKAIHIRHLGRDIGKGAQQ
jgi:hypothetical protein